ncbi:related to cell wall protein cwl1 [Ramularia collo-cygni]|uniref:Reticulon-like protein n=1 Tax=Ramularia collo-cygni TaxID=112498 RepID=A0A2D3VMX0_9PEZI|nr:related to cell wall protein cwl1 [Ramularia collo-cygni]CZT25249.1 related to cell wall protein cwl1 [Ramularia collo-cygni]
MADSTSPANITPAQYPDLNPSQQKSSGGGILSNASQTAQQTMENIKNSQTVQSVANGPLADKARTEATATKNEFSNLAASRQTPQTQTANGQDLTHYHSFFYNLLSWENPRATAISYASIVILVFATRYLPITRYTMKALYMLLGLTAAAEIIGKVALGQGVASKMRPKKYYTIPHETLESVLADTEELINFFVIEFQRIVFAENVYATGAAFISAFVTYFLVKIMPKWGLFLFFTTVVYFAPLAYISNKEFIDEHLNNASTIVSEQANQVRDIAGQHASKAVEASRSAIKDYSSQASELIGQGKKAAVDKGIVKPETAEKVASATVTPEKAVSSSDFPSAPKVEPVIESTQVEPLNPEHPVTRDAEPLLA